MILALIIFILAVFLLVYLNFSNIKIELRELPIIPKIFYGVSLAAEKGRPIIFSTGLTGLGPLLYACVEILKEIARRSARLDIKLLIPQNDPPSLAYVNQALQSVYASEGKISKYDPLSVVFLSEEQFAYAAGYIGLLKRENVAAAFLFGYFAGEALILAESGKNVGAFQIAGSVSPEQVAFFLVTCEDVALGDELYAVSAKLSGDKNILYNLRVADILKLLCLVIILIGSAIHTKQTGFLDKFLTIPVKQNVQRN